MLNFLYDAIILILNQCVRCKINLQTIKRNESNFLINLKWIKITSFIVSVSMITIYIIQMQNLLSQKKNITHVNNEKQLLSKTIPYNLSETTLAKLSSSLSPSKHVNDVWYAIITPVEQHNKNDMMRHANVLEVKKMWPEVDLFNASDNFDQSCVNVLLDYNISVSNRYFSDEKGFGWIHTGKIGIWCSFLRFVLECSQKNTLTCVWLENDLLMSENLKNVIIRESNPDMLQSRKQPLTHIGNHNEVLIINKRKVHQVILFFRNFIISRPLDHTLWNSGLSLSKRIFHKKFDDQNVRLFNKPSDSSIVCASCALTKTEDINKVIANFKQNDKTGKIHNDDLKIIAYDNYHK